MIANWTNVIKSSMSVNWNRDYDSNREKDWDTSSNSNKRKYWNKCIERTIVIDWDTGWNSIKDKDWSTLCDSIISFEWNNKVKCIIIKNEIRYPIVTHTSTETIMVIVPGYKIEIWCRIVSKEVIETQYVIVSET